MIRVECRLSIELCQVIITIVAAVRLTMLQRNPVRQRIIAGLRPGPAQGAGRRVSDVTCFRNMDPARPMVCHIVGVHSSAFIRAS
jgi:hypothetical protein